MALRPLTITFVLTSALGAGACSQDEPGRPTAAPSPAASPAGTARSLASYCSLDQEIDRLHRRTGAALGPDFTERELEVALVGFAVQALSVADAARSVAPEELAADAETIYELIKAGAKGDAAAVMGDEIEDATERTEAVCRNL